MSILVDTGAWYAIVDTSDRHHKEAKRFYSEQVSKAPFITTDLILAETWTLINSHIGRSAARTFWETLRETRIPILTIEPVDLEAAWRIGRDFSDQTFSLVDCCTFAVMERMGTSEAFTFDAHFLTYRYGPTRQRVFRCSP
ncbi:MAG: PIN domain-containing protein [Deltaproteobacteria bacterium]|nr:PIN domain-containing protein [Deltaproteobacteria bacterium]